MDKIYIEELEINACHGALGFEKTTPQPFIISAEMSVDFYAAANGDDLSKTVNYAEVCDFLQKTTEENCFNLIETLAYKLAFGALKNFPAVKDISLKVQKPKAPVSRKVKNLAVSVFAERQTAYLSLGSNLGDKKGYLDFAVRALSQTEGVTVEAVSDYIKTEPYGGVATEEFLNAAVKITTFLTPRQLLSEINRIESDGGRTRGRRWDNRTLDIDIIFFGKKVIREDDLIIPHPDYFNRDFVLTPLKQIAPDFVCPVKGVPISKMKKV